METQELFVAAIAKLKVRMPSAFDPHEQLPPIGGDRSFENDEPGWIKYFEDKIRCAEWPLLSEYYQKRVIDLYRVEQGSGSGAPPPNRCLNLRCRALIQTLGELE